MSSDWYPGIARFCDHWKHAPMLQQTFETLKQTFSDGNDACIDASKSLVECACRVIIETLDDAVNPVKDWKNSPIKGENPSFNNWVSACLMLLEIQSVRDDPFSKVISRHFDLVDALGKFRDKAGPVSHGKDGFSQKLSAHHRRAAVLAADALVAFLHEAYLEHEPDAATTLEPYERFGKSNAVIDRFVSASATPNEDGWLVVKLQLPENEMRELLVEPSRLLFGSDREAYKDILGLCREAEAIAGDGEPEEAA